MKKLIIIAFLLMVIPSVCFANGTSTPATTTPPIIPTVEKFSPATISWTNWIPRVQYVNIWNNTINWLTSHFTQGRVVCSKTSHPFGIDMFFHPWNDTSANTFMSLNPMNKTMYGYEMSLGEIDAFDLEGDYLYKRTFHTVEFPDSLKGYYCRTISDCKGVELVSNEFQL